MITKQNNNGPGPHNNNVICPLKTMGQAHITTMGNTHTTTMGHAYRTTSMCISFAALRRFVQCGQFGVKKWRIFAPNRSCSYNDNRSWTYNNNGQRPHDKLS